MNLAFHTEEAKNVGTKECTPDQVVNLEAEEQV